MTTYSYGTTVFDEQELFWAVNVITVQKKHVQITVDAQRACQPHPSKQTQEILGELLAVKQTSELSWERIFRILAAAIKLEIPGIQEETGLNPQWADMTLALLA